MAKTRAVVVSSEKRRTLTTWEKRSDFSAVPESKPTDQLTLQPPHETWKRTRCSSDPPPSPAPRGAARA